MRVGQNETAAEQTWPRANTGGRRGSPYTPRGGGLRRRIHSSIVYSYNTEQNDIMHEQAVNLKSWKNMLLTPRVTFLFITLPRRWDVATGQQQQNVICFLFLSLFHFLHNHFTKSCTDDGLETAVLEGRSRKLFVHVIHRMAKKRDQMDFGDRIFGAWCMIRAIWIQKYFKLK